MNLGTAELGSLMKLQPLRATLAACALALVPQALPAAAVRAVAPAPRAPTGDAVPFQEFGEAFLKAHGAKDAASLPIEKLLAEHYVRGAVGVIDVAYPLEFLEDKARQEELRAQCAALVDMQTRWVEWLAGPDARCKPGLDAAKQLAAWIKGWKPPVFAKLKNGKGAKELYAALGAEADVVAAQKTFDALLRDAEVLGAVPKDGARLSLVFAPTRRNFVELAGYAGLRDAGDRETLWQPSTPKWTTFWIGWNFVCALEYPAWSEDPQFRSGTPMNKFDPTGREQHTVQNAANGLQWLCFGEDDATYLHQALSMNLAVAVCGGCNTLEGDLVRGTTGAQTQPYEKFVPGGNPAGGVLPPIPAAGGDALKDGRWRDGKGKDHFAGVLRKNQKDGWKEITKHRPEKLDPALARDQDAHFPIMGPQGEDKIAVSAPFLGPYANEKPYPPQSVLLDYREFFRAYKCCFFAWMQSNADKDNAETSAVKFRELLRKVALRSTDTGFEALVKEIYGVPLSARNGETASLEWRFLQWLAKGGKFAD